MMTCWLHPVPELRVELGATLEVSTPWVHGELDVPDEARPWVDARIAELGTGWIPASGPLREFVAPLLELPIWLHRAAPPCREGAGEIHRALRVARLPEPDAFDALALVSAMRWRSWAHEALTASSAALADAAGHAGRAGLHVLLRQELEVTRACEPAIRPACDAFPFANSSSGSSRRRRVTIDCSRPALTWSPVMRSR